jgi:hypothetical protein
MYSTIPIHWNIISAPASPGRSRVGPSLYVFSLLECTSHFWSESTTHQITESILDFIKSVPSVRSVSFFSSYFVVMPWDILTFVLKIASVIMSIFLTAAGV